MWDTEKGVKQCKYMCTHGRLRNTLETARHTHHTEVCTRGGHHTRVQGGVQAVGLTMAETVKSLSCILSINQSTFRRVLTKMTA